MEIININTEIEKPKPNIYDLAIQELEVRRERVLSGKVNSIPLSFPRFSYWFPGLEQGMYLLITANQKIGKSKLSDKLFLYDPFFYSFNFPDQLKVKVLYFTLEMSKQRKVNDFFCYLLYKLDNIRVSGRDLRSTDKNKPLPQEYLDLLKTERYQTYIRKFNETVEFIDSIKNPTGINKHCREFALANGKLIMKMGKQKDELTGKMVDKEFVDYYQPDDPDLYKIIILDNYSNLTEESGMNKMQNIEKLSKYFITLRDQMNFSIVAVQHQAQAQESIENMKNNRLMPTSDGLADCKTTARDVNMALGLYSPYKYGIKDYQGYDITKFRNKIRFLEIMEDRDGGGSNSICPLYFDGAVGEFKELPLPEELGLLQPVYELIDSLDRRTTNKTETTNG